MKLHIQNLGPIKEATIDLSKRFYTFVGYNNSGKTYLANLLKCVFEGRHRSLQFVQLILSSIVRSKEDIEAGVLHIKDDDLRNILLQCNIFYKNIALTEALNINTDSPILRNLSLQFEIDNSINIRLLSQLLNDWNPNSSDKIEHTLHSNTLIFNYNPKSRLSLFRIIDKIITHLLPIPSTDGINYLPTERLSLMSFYKYFYRIEQIKREEIGNYLKDINQNNIQLGDLKEIAENSYLEVNKNLINRLFNLNDVIDDIEELGEDSFHQNDDFVGQLENIMQGKIQTSSNPINGDLSFRFEMQDNKESLKLHTTSSSINQLSTLYLYWKYWAGKSDNFLIIDEPEQNLHPENQIKLTELLIQFANRNNNRVLIATHSPLIAEVINNYLILGQLENQEEERKNLGMAENAALTPENTGIYFFTGDRVKEYTISDYGTVFEDFKAAQDKVWDLSYKLGNKMYQQLKQKVDAQN